MLREERVRCWSLVSMFVGILLLSMGWACNSSTPPPTAPSKPQASVPLPSPAPAPAPAPFARYQVSGIVTDQADNPLAALVEMDHYRGGGSYSNPPSRCPDPGYCWLTLSTNRSGGYAAELDAAPDPRRPSMIGYVFAMAGNYETNIQLLPSGATAIVQGMRLRLVRQVTAGASIAVSVESDSSRCTDLEDFWALDYRCEVIRVVAATAGTLVIEARATEPGGTAPLVGFFTSGNYTGLPTMPEPGVIHKPVGGGTYQILVGVPDTTPGARTFNVSTTLRPPDSR